MNIQFHHEREYVYNEHFEMFTHNINPRGGTTYALSVPPLDRFLHMAAFSSEGPYILELGIARCSDEDNYNKAIGRQISAGRMKPVLWSVYPVSYGRIDLTNMESITSCLQLRLVSEKAELILKRSGNRVYFVEVL